MARYGIRLKQAERAWLVETNELRREIERLSAMSTDRDTVRDSIPYPVEVPVEVAKPLPWWKQAFLTLGYGSALVMAFLIVIGYLRKRLPL